MRRYHNRKPKKLFSSLCAIGVHAQLAERGRPEERYRFDYGGSSGESLGIIDIAQSPIGWVNLARDCVDTLGTVYETVYGVPDLRNLPRLEIRAIPIKSFPLFGKVIDVRWKPIDDSGIAHALTNDSAIRDPIMKLGSWFNVPIVAS